MGRCWFQSLIGKWLNYQSGNLKRNQLGLGLFKSEMIIKKSLKSGDRICWFCILSLGACVLVCLFFHTTHPWETISSMEVLREHGEIFVTLMSCVTGVDKVHTIPLALDLDSCQFRQPKQRSCSDLSDFCITTPLPHTNFWLLKVKVQ